MAQEHPRPAAAGRSDGDACRCLGVAGAGPHSQRQQQTKARNTGGSALVGKAASDMAVGDMGQFMCDDGRNSSAVWVFRISPEWIRIC